MPKNEENISIIGFEASNVRKITHIEMNLNDKGCTIIGGSNGACKTTILTLLKYMVQNKATAIHNLKTEGSEDNVHCAVKLSNGWELKLMANKVALKGEGVEKNSTAALLKTIITDFALDIPSFMSKKPSSKVKMLLDAIGVSDELENLQKEQTVLETRRLTLFHDKQKDQANYEALPYYEEAPKEAPSASELIQKSQEILSANQMRDAERNKITQTKALIASKESSINHQKMMITDLEEKLINSKTLLLATEKELEVEQNNLKLAESQDVPENESIDSLNEEIKKIDQIKYQISCNNDKIVAQDKSEQSSMRHSDADKAVKENMIKQKKLLDEVNSCLPGLEIKESKILYKGFDWDDLSTAEQIKVSVGLLKDIDKTAMFAFVDRLESLDKKETKDLDQWAKSVGIKILGTQVIRDINSMIDSEEADVVLEEGNVIINKTIPLEEVKPKEETALQVITEGIQVVTETLKIEGF